MITEVRTIPELSKETGISEYTLRQLCRTGKLPYLPVGNRWFIKVADFDALFRKEESKDGK